MPLHTECGECLRLRLMILLSPEIMAIPFTLIPPQINTQSQQLTDDELKILTSSSKRIKDLVINLTKEVTWKDVYS